METFVIDSLAQELYFKKGGDLRGHEGGRDGEITKKLRRKFRFYDENYIFF